MNDNDRGDERTEAAWVHDLLEKHDLYLRADTLEGAVLVLLGDAAFDIKAVTDVICKGRMVTPASLAEVKRIIAMLKDATAFANLCDHA